MSNRHGANPRFLLRLGRINVVFDRQYYGSIWGSVHRHDYCQSLADSLISDFGKVRFLDLGTGCGFLVKTLRGKGCDAWGLEISDYALANSCAPGYVVQGSVTDIPFKDGSFDLVVSNGLWSYVPEKDVPKGRDEIWRVGSEQRHNIDHDGTDYMDAYRTWKPLAWWNEHLAAPKVLVSCPTHESKQYAHEAWLKMARAIEYPNYEIFVVDNSATPDCAQRWGFTWLKTEGDQCHRMAASMEMARQKFLNENFAWWWNVEIDVIPHPQMLKTLIRYGKDADWVAHCYPARGGTEEICSGVGCSLFSRRLIENFSFANFPARNGNGVDALLWDWVRPQKKYKTRELWGHLPIQHLDG